MGKLNLMFAMIIAGFAVCFGGERKTFERPVITAANISVIDVMGVELTDTATLLHMQGRYIPGNWIRIGMETYLEADGRRYALRSGEGLTPGEAFYLPESGVADFTLNFEPMPLETERFDFVSGNGPGAFRLWGVDFSGKPQEKFPEGLPVDMRTDVTDGALPDVDYGIGTTTLNFTLLNFKEGMSDDIKLRVIYLDGNMEELPLKFDGKGTANVSFEQFGLAKIRVSDGNDVHFGMFWVASGETADVYVDMRVSGYYVMAARDNEHVEQPRIIYVKGKYGNLNAVKALYPEDYRMQLYTGNFADYKMSGDEYFDMVMDEFHALSDSISATGYPRMAKELAMIDLKNDALTAIVTYRFLLEQNYRNINGFWSYTEPIPYDLIKAELGDKHYSAFVKEIDPGDDRLLFGDVSLAVGTVDWSKYGVKGEMPQATMLYSNVVYKAKQGTMTQEDIDTLRTLKNPFYAAACDSLRVKQERECERIAKMKLVQPTPDVAADEVLDAIVAPHKGKVVLVDLWNTWCGPCRAAIKANEPLKDGELNSDDIVWIYIADESSPVAKYLSMLPEIKGLHYRVSEEQINAIYERFNVEGIPYYILVDRDGNATGHPDFRNHDTMMNGIKAALAR